MLTLALKRFPSNPVRAWEGNTGTVGDRWPGRCPRKSGHVLSELNYSQEGHRGVLYISELSDLQRIGTVEWFLDSLERALMLLSSVIHPTQACGALVWLLSMWKENGVCVHGLSLLAEHGRVSLLRKDPIMATSTGHI